MCSCFHHRPLGLRTGCSWLSVSVWLLAALLVFGFGLKDCLIVSDDEAVPAESLRTYLRGGDGQYGQNK